MQKLADRGNGNYVYPFRKCLRWSTRSAMATPRPPSPAPVVASETIALTPSRECLTVKVCHKAPNDEKSERSYQELRTDQGAPGDFADASPDFKFGAAVAAFGLALRDAPSSNGPTLGVAIELAQQAIGAVPGGCPAGFIALARRAQTIQQADGD